MSEATPAGGPPAAEPPAEGADGSHPHHRRHRGFAHWFEKRFRSAVAIYGLIVYAAFITIAADHAASVWEILETAVGTLLVFFIAHTFAHTLTDHGTRGLRAATAHALRHASGMLYAAVPATVVLLVAAYEDLPAADAFTAAIWTTTIVLGVLGYLAYGRRGASVGVRILGAVGTAALGLLIVLLEYAIH